MTGPPTGRLPAPALPPWLEAMLPFERYRVDVGGYAMHVMERGEGLPVVLVHGNPTWGLLYRQVAEELAGESMRVIMPDLIGLGLTTSRAAAAPISSPTTRAGCVACSSSSSWSAA